MKIEIKPNDKRWVGKKIRHSSWDFDVEVLFVGREGMVVKRADGEAWYRLSQDWELYEEPKEEDANIPNSFIPGICPNGKLTESYASYHNPKKNPKLLSPAIITFTDGSTIHYQVLPWLYDMESAERAKDKSKRRGDKFIWPALDANGKPIQYLIEEDN